MSAIDKYKQYRQYLDNGDIVLFHGTKALAQIIQESTGSYWNHVGIIEKAGDRLHIIDSNANGLQTDFLSDRMKYYADFCIVRPIREPEDKEVALTKLFERGESGTRYDFFLLPRIWIFNATKKLGFKKPWNIKRLGRKDADICSEAAKFYADALELGYKTTPDNWSFTPADFIRYADPVHVWTLFTDGHQ